MELPNSILDRYNDNKKQKKPASHEKAAAVNEIIRVLGENKTYSYTYWLRKIGSASYSTVLGILKQAEDLESKYSKGGFVTNQLKPYALSKTKARGPRTDGGGTGSAKSKVSSKSGSPKTNRGEVSGSEGVEQHSIPEVDGNERSVERES